MKTKNFYREEYLDENNILHYNIFDESGSMFESKIITKLPLLSSILSVDDYKVVELTFEDIVNENGDIIPL